MVNKHPLTTAPGGFPGMRGCMPIRIADFRDAVDALNWNRTDISGATRSEWLRMDVKSRLERHISKVEELRSLVPFRFTFDLAHAEASLQSARGAVDRWERARADAKELPPFPPPANA